MKNLFSAFIATLLCLTAAAQEITFKEWQQEGATSLGLEKARSVNRSFDNRDEALVKGEGRFYMPLKKGWSKPETARNIEGKVASNTFFIPKTWVGRDIYLHIGKGDKSYYLSVNGNVLGYVENSREVAQFRVEDYLHLDGDNRIDLLYLDAATGSLLEAKQDGLEVNRDIYLFAQPKVHIQDIHIAASLDDSLKNGVLELDMFIKNGYNVNAEVNIGYDIVNAEGEIVTYNNRDMDIPARTLDTLHLSRILRNVNGWSPEKPYLYTLILRVKHEGRMVEYIPFKIGFRNVTIKDNTLAVNGKKTFLKGHVSSDPDILTKERIKTLKAKGVNAIAYSVQPKSDKLYNLCDSMGMLLVDQINIGSRNGDTDRKIGGTTANNPTYLDVYTQRIERRYLTARNHPSVIIWSLGEGVGNGFNMYRGYLQLKALDPHRPILHKGSGGEWNSDLNTEKRNNDLRPVVSFKESEKGSIGQFIAR